MNTKKMKVTFIATVILSLLLIVTLFLPFASATDSNREQLLKNPEYENVEIASLTNADMTEVSLFEYVKVYSYMAKNDILKSVSIVCMSIVIAFAVLSVITLLFSILRKPIAIIIFDVLAMINFLVIRFDFSDRGVIPSSSYNWGYANYIVFILGALILAGAIIMLIGKIQEKRKNNEI